MHSASRTPTERASLIGVAEVASLLGVEVRHVRRLVHERRIPFIKWGHLLRFDPAEVEVWIDEHRNPASGDRPPAGWIRPA